MITANSLSRSYAVGTTCQSLPDRPRAGGRDSNVVRAADRRSDHPKGGRPAHYRAGSPDEIIFRGFPRLTVAECMPLRAPRKCAGNISGRDGFPADVLGAG